MAVVASAAVRYAIFGWTDDLPFVLFFPAVIGASIFFNHGSGLFATALSAVLAVSFFMGDAPLSSARNIVRLRLFCGVGGLITFAAETGGASKSLRGQGVEKGRDWGSSRPLG